MVDLQVSQFPRDGSAEEGSEFGFSFRFLLNREFGDPSTPSGTQFDYQFVFDSATPDDISTEATSGTITFEEYGFEGAQRITFDAIADGITEPTESLQLNLSNLVGPPGGRRPVFPSSGGDSATFNLQIEDECFLLGTNILTENGYRPVEELEIGDKVKTFDGKIEEIRWIGKQTRHRDNAHPLRSLPIQIKAGALGNGLPTNDLYISPDHALLVEGLLINAGALVNDISIVKTYPEKYVYYHVELANHDLLVAEGTPAESFYPNREDRLVYDNGAEYARFYPYGNSQLMLYPLDYPRISSTNKVPKFISQKLMQIAEEVSRKTALVA